MKNIVIGIDASRNRSGGAKNHLIGILRESDPKKHGIKKIHVWTYRALSDVIIDQPWLIKHNPKELECSIAMQLWWQRFKFPIEAKRAGCSIVLNTDAGTISRFKPAVTMSRDMLSYELGEIERFNNFSKSRIRLMLLRYIQNSSLRSSDGVIFLTKYAANVIQNYCGRLPHFAIIPHGVGHEFKNVKENQMHSKNFRKDAIGCLYVSNVAMYKHQWSVVRAIAMLRKHGHDIHLTLAGGGAGSGVDRAQKLLEQEIFVSDPDRSFVTQIGYVPYKELPFLIKNHDIFIFASSCENMPNTLIEAMAVGLPIACSNRGPMSEVLEDGGVYFDPEDVDSIAVAVEKLIIEKPLRQKIAQKAKLLSERYSWDRCASETWDFLVNTYKNRKT